jgi:hypothetical protein
MFCPFSTQPTTEETSARSKHPLVCKRFVFVNFTDTEEGVCYGVVRVCAVCKFQRPPRWFHAPDLGLVCFHLGPRLALPGRDLGRDAGTLTWATWEMHPA